MDELLKWRYAKIGSDWAIVADNLPGYRAEIGAAVPAQGRKIRVWTFYEQQQVIARGATTCTVLAKRACVIHLKIAKEFPPFDRLPPLDRTTIP